MIINKARFIYLMCILLLSSCLGEESFYEKVSRETSWKFPDCLKEAQIVDFKNYSSVTDYGYKYIVQLDNGCLDIIIELNDLTSIDSSTYSYTKESVNRPLESLHVNLLKNQLEIIFFEE